MADRPTKAYRVELPALVIKSAIVWADSIVDATQRFYVEGEGDNVEVIDNDYYERRLRRPRRMPSEDRAPRIEGSVNAPE